MELSCSLLACIFIAILTLFYWYSTKNHDYWKKQNIPCLPNPLPLFGHMLPVIFLQESSFSFTNKAYKSTSASMIGFNFSRKPGLIVRDPELVKCVMQSNFTSFQSNSVSLNEKTDPVLAKNPFFAANPEVWKSKRIHITNHLSGKKLKHLLVIIQEVCSKMNEFVERKINEHGDFYECEMKTFFVKFTGEVVANAAFGIEGQSFQDNPDRLSFTKTAECVLQPNLMNKIKQSLLFVMPDLGEFLGVKFLPDHSDAFFRENIKAIINQRRQQNNNPNDYLQFSLESNAEDDLDSIIADVAGFYLDVYETTSTTLGHIFYHLSENQNVQTKLREHIIEKLNGGPITYEVLKELTYVDQVLNETLRISPPLGVFMKRCTENVTLTGSDGLKCQLQPGSPVYIPVMNLHNDDKYWSNPEIFDPDRFDPDNQISITKYAYLPFGEGPRMCVGMRLGVMLVKMAIITLLTKYKLEHSPKTIVPLEMEPTAIMTLYKGGLWIRFRKLH